MLPGAGPEAQKVASHSFEGRLSPCSAARRFRLGLDWGPAWKAPWGQPVAGLLEHRGVSLTPQGGHNLCRSDALDVECGIPRLWLADEYLHRVLNSTPLAPTGKIRIDNVARSTVCGVKGGAGSPLERGGGRARAWITPGALSASSQEGAGLTSASASTFRLALTRAVWVSSTQSFAVCVLAMKNTITEDEDRAFHTPTSQRPGTPMQSLRRS